MEWDRWWRWPRDEDWGSAFDDGTATDWWMVVLTAILTAAAVIAGGVAIRQLRAIDTQLNAAEKARKTSIRPVLHVHRLFVLPFDDDHRFIELKLQNVGLAAARNVTIKAFAFEFPDDVWNDRERRFQPFVKECEAKLSQSPPPLEAPVEALMAMATSKEFETAYLLSNARSRSHIPLRTDRALVFLTAEFFDLDGTRYAYPSEPNPGKLTWLWRVAQFQNRLPDVDA